MWNYIWVSVSAGILFGILDGAINANPLAQRLYEAYKPIARSSVNAVAGMPDRPRLRLRDGGSLPASI